MHQHLLAIASHDLADRLHRGVAIALSITRVAVINVPTPEAVWTVVAMPAARDRCTNELFAVDAFECLVVLGSWRSSQSRPCAFALGLLLRFSAELFKCFVIVFVQVFVICE